MEITGIFIAIGVLFLLCLCWFGLHYITNPPLADADATAKVTGSCGDTMELQLHFNDDRVDKVRSWTDGCAVSGQCVDAAAMLARGKSAEELRTINMMHIMDIVGQLPDTHLHCAQLAETTLQQALKNYIGRQSSCKSCKDGG